MKKRVVSIMLVLAMTVASLVGCGSSQKSDDSPTVITIASTDVLDSRWPETEVWKEIQKRANVEIEYMDLDEDQFSLLLAGGDIPDIVCGNFADKVNDIVSSGIALDMAPLLEEYAPNIMQDCYAARNELIQTYKGGENNALYFVSRRLGVELPDGGTDTTRGYLVNWEYYKELGAPAIANDDDYIDVLERMVAAHPKTENGEKTYAMGLYDDLTVWYFRAPFIKATAANPWTFRGHQYMAKFEDGTLINGYTDTEQGAFWVDMEFYNKVYKKGLLDPDSFTQTSEEHDTKMGSGRYMASANHYNSWSLYDVAVSEDPNTLQGMMRIPTENAVTFANKKSMAGDFPSAYMFVGAKSENWEAALRFLNVLHDLDTQRILRSGIEGVHWNYVDGVPTWTDEVMKMKAESDPKLETIGIAIDTFPLYTVLEGFEHPDGYPVDLGESEDIRISVMNTIEKDYSAYYDVEVPAKTGMKYVEEGKTIDLSNDHAQLVAACMPAMPTDVERILEKCDDILYRAIPKLVMAETEEEFASIQKQVLSDLAKAGEADAWKWCSEEYEAAAEVVDPIFESLDW